jgi:hypothetical protein
MTYAMPCETFRFAWRNERLVLSVSANKLCNCQALRRRPLHRPSGGPPPHFMGEDEAGSGTFLPCREAAGEGVRLATRGPSLGVTKLHKSALKSLQSLVRVTLYAGRVRPPPLFERLPSVRCP